jgi:hypothetical protein
MEGLNDGGGGGQGIQREREKNEFFITETVRAGFNVVCALVFQKLNAVF